MPAQSGVDKPAPSAAGASITITIAIDAMGGDFGPAVTVPAALDFLATHAAAHVILVGLEEAIRAQLKQSRAATDRLSVHHATQVVAMHERPAQALRGKKDLLGSLVTLEMVYLSSLI